MADAASLLTRVDAPVGLPDPLAPPQRTMSLDDAALPLLTDLQNGPTVTVDPALQIDQALELMRTAAVRLCLVVDARRQLLGAISAADIQGDRPMRVLQAQAADRRAASRRELTVAQLMHPASQLLFLRYRDAARATIRTVVDAMKRIGQRHLLVIDVDRAGRHTLRGLFAASRIERATGQTLDIHPMPTSFADYERAVEHPELS